MRCIPWIVTLSLVLTVLAGCLTAPDDTDPGGPSPEDGYTPVEARHLLPFETTGWRSQVLEKGPHAVDEVLDVHVEFDLPLGYGLPTGTVNLGVFLPDVPEGTRVPVIVEAGPYFDEEGFGSPPVTTPAPWLPQMLVEEILPHGFAVAQLSVPGTGRSGGCMDMMGPVEAAGIEAAMDWLGTQDWSNGNVGLIGRSYDGSTPWMAGMTGNEHVKTVVPLSGLWGMHELMWRNGSAESRAPGLLWAIYYTYRLTPASDGVGLDYVDRFVQQAACRDTQTGAVQGAAAYATGDFVLPQVNDYWVERSFRERMLGNYEGSVYLIHGMQDWNVDPHMAFPFYGELQEKGLDIKGLFGQWAHHYPDRHDEHSHLRWDWAQDLLEWFTYYLKEEGPRPQLHVEMQDDAGAWRIEETWPPRDLAWRPLTLTLAGCNGAGCALPGDSPNVSPASTLRVDLGAVEEETLIAGLPRLHVAATPLGPGGQLYAELRDKTEDRRIGHAIMDLRLHAGGWEAQPVVPGQEITARMEFFPLDAVVPAGNELELVLSNTGRQYLPSVLSHPVLVDLDRTTFRIPVIERGPEAYFEVVPWDPDADRPDGP